MIDAPFSIRLEELYQVMSETEKNDLSRFLASPFFNRDKCLLQLHRFLNGAEAAERYDKHSAWKFVFDKHPYNEKKFRYMVSDLIASIEEFIYFNKLQKPKPRFTTILNTYYTLKGATENKKALASEVQRNANKTPAVIDSSFYLEKQFESELLEEINTTSLKAYRKYVETTRTADAAGLDVFYLIEKLRQLCIVANDNNVLGLKSAVFNQTDVLKIVRTPHLQQNFFIAAYVCVYGLLTQKQERSYFKLKELIDKYGYDMDENNLAELLTYARNFCIARINAGEPGFFDELFDLYRQGLAKGALLPNGEINERTYKNIVTTALRTNQYQWAHEFINDYKYQLNKMVRENAFNYNLANYFFHTKQYDKVLRNLQKVQLNDLFYGLDARSLMIKCYFEKDEKEAFMNAYYSFKVFVQRRKNVSAQHQRNYLNFLKFSKKLINIRPKNRKSVEKLALEIKNAVALADKNWLESKMNQYLETA